MTVREMRALRVGDVVLRYHRDGRVQQRVIRYVTPPERRGIGSRFFVACVKQRRSQYPAPITFIYPEELLERDYQPTGKRLSLRSKMDRRIANYIAARTTADMRASGVTQNDVVGVVS